MARLACPADYRGDKFVRDSPTASRRGNPQCAKVGGLRIDVIWTSSDPSHKTDRLAIELRQEEGSRRREEVAPVRLVKRRFIGVPSLVRLGRVQQG
jgi:hypothetical protein